ncbi:MAG: FtsQ-type POTRA domain-containing protein [Clostridiales bacterium]|nr:FtsQ-type POTRA domain-containing protein [Clostridiales bacterium]
MKNKSLIISLSILAVIVLFVVLSSTIFCLKSVEINFVSNTIHLTQKEDEIIETTNFKYNQSIFFVNKQKYKNEIEQNYPYIKIINIETIFPNKLIVNAVERNELFTIKTYEENAFKNYLVLDDELKVLNTYQSFTNSHLNPILINIEGEFTQTNSVGSFLTSGNNDLIKNLAVELYAYNNNPLLLKANFEEINLNYGSTGDVRILMRSGVEIKLKDATTRLSEKFMLALSYYNELTDKTTGTITTYVNNEDKVVGYYVS